MALAVDTGGTSPFVPELCLRTGLLSWGLSQAALPRGEDPLKAEFSACRATRNGTGKGKGHSSLRCSTPKEKKDPDNSPQLCPYTCCIQIGEKYLYLWRAQGMLRCWCFSPQTSMSVRAEIRVSTSAGTAWAASSVCVLQDIASCPTAKPAKVRRAILQCSGLHRNHTQTSPSTWLSHLSELAV